MTLWRQCFQDCGPPSGVRVVDALSRLLPCEGVGLILLNRRSEQAERIAVGGGFAVPASTALAAGQAEGGLLRQVCDREPLVLDTQTSSQPKALGDLAEHSLLITPVMQPEYPQPLGCLLVADHAEGFSAETVGLLTAVARRTALAIENAQLYDALEKEPRQLRGSAAYGHHHPGKRAQTSG